MCFSPFVRPHATNKILSTGKKKRVQSNGDGEQELEKCWTGGKIVKPQDYIQEQPSRITKRNRGNTSSFISGKAVRAQRSVLRLARASAGEF